MQTAGNLLFLIMLGSWGGTMLFYSFIVTPTLFSMLGRDEGGRAVNALFPAYYLALLGFSLGVAVVTAARASTAATAGWPAWTIAGLGVAAALISAYSRWIFLHRIGQAARGTPEFSQLHLISLGINFVVLALFVICAMLVARYPNALLGPAASSVQPNAGH